MLFGLMIPVFSGRADPSRITHASEAGDTAVVTFLSAILGDNSLVDALKYAAMAGKGNLYCNSFYDELPDWNQLTEKIQNEPNELIKKNN